MTQSLLERRRIEAEFAKSILESLTEDVGRERAIAILVRAVIGLAEKAGETFAAQRRDGPNNGFPDLLAYADILSAWAEGDALTIDLKLREADRLEFDVLRCRYADMYRALGVADLGAVLSCNRDKAFCIGFNPMIRLTRTQTIMEGADHCDFRYAIETGPAPDDEPGRDG
ncbi:L-2-amino-thiazoline-4-carboxylic acid hydrolase [Methylocapsa acidiphila]|uniref:L-2-amino-thiazoline-4-carboxylic acid hydrolase n=1 Tax=Methylocapsa acidiphila TaxID=133552 RepID=UPI000406F678|nr:L-2-amino-thiazoline-4-carboxylic acid hydrolase [Methylocapsa acidiphila]